MSGWKAERCAYTVVHPLTVEVEGQSIPPTGHLDPGNGPVLRCENGVALLPFGPDIEAGMEMSRPDFTKIPAEFEWNRQWSMKRVLRSGTVDCAPHTRPR